MIRFVIIVLLIILPSTALGAQQTIGGAFAAPSIPHIESGSLDIEGRLLDAADERHASIVQAPKTGNIRKVIFRTGTVTTGATVDVRIETVDTVTGFPSGTLWATNTNVSHTIQDTDDNTCLTTAALTADAAVVIGDIFSGVIDNPDVSPGNFAIGVSGNELGRGGVIGTAHYTGGAWTREHEAPIVAFEYDDGSYEWIPGAWPFCTIDNVNYNVNSSPSDELSLTFTLPFPQTVRGVGFYGEFDGQADIILYDGVNNPSVTVYPSMRQGSSEQVYRLLFDEEVALAKDTVYRVGIKPTTTTNISLPTYSVPSQAMRGAMDGGTSFYLSTRADDGTWTDDTLSRPMVQLLFSGGDDAVNGGGGGGGGVAQGGEDCFEVSQTVTFETHFLIEDATGTTSSATTGSSRLARFYNSAGTLVDTVSDGEFSQVDATNNPGLQTFPFDTGAVTGRGKLVVQGTTTAGPGKKTYVIDIRGAGECNLPPNFGTMYVAAGGGVKLDYTVNVPGSPVDGSIGQAVYNAEKVGFVGDNVKSDPQAGTMTGGDFGNKFLNTEHIGDQLAEALALASKFTVTAATSRVVTSGYFDDPDPKAYRDSHVLCNNKLRKIHDYTPDPQGGAGTIHTGEGIGDEWVPILSPGIECLHLKAVR